MKTRLLIFLFTVFLPTLALAVDVDGDGFHELFLFNGFGGGDISVLNSNGTQLHNINIPETAREDKPVLFKAQWQHPELGSLPIVFSLRMDSDNNGTMIAFSPNGREARVDLGQLKKSTIAVADYDKNGSSDIFFVAPNRQVSVIVNPLDGNTRPIELGVRIKNNERFFLFGRDNGIGRYAAKGRGRRITLEENGTRSRVAGPAVPKKALLISFYDANGTSSQFYGSEKTNKKTKQKRNVFYQLGSKKRYRLTTTNPISPGYYLDTGDSIPQFARAVNSRIEIYKITDPEIPITSFRSNVSLPDGIDFPNDTGGGECLDFFPKDTLDRALQAWDRRDIGTFQGIMADVNRTNFCPDIRRRIADYIGNGLRTVSLGTRSATLETQYALLGSPHFSTDDIEKKKAGCDKLRTGDGPNGWILKASDHGGRLVTLSPGNFNSTRAELVKLNGDIVEKLDYTGRSNPDHTGWRGTFRGKKFPNQYPKKLIVKFYVNESFFSSGSDNSTAWCFETKNSHVRND